MHRTGQVTGKTKDYDKWESLSFTDTAANMDSTDIGLGNEYMDIIFMDAIVRNGDRHEHERIQENQCVIK